MTLKGHEKFGQRLNCGFQISPPKIGEFLSSRQEAWIFKFYWFVFSKREIAWAKIFYRTLILGHWRAIKSLGKNWIVVFKPAPQILVNVFPAGEKGLIFKCYLFVLSKRQIAWTKNFHRCSILWPWKVRAKTESLFPSQPPKMNFFPLGKKRRIFKFYWFVLSKRQIAWTKNFNRSLILWHWRARKSSGKNWIMVSKSAPQKLVNFFLPGEKGGIFKFYWFVLSKRQLAWTKSFHRGLMLWHRRVMKSLTKNQIVVSK